MTSAAVEFLAMVGAAGAGVVSWTLAEYGLHRFVFHGYKGKAFGAYEHRLHHARVDWFAPWWMKAVAAVAATGMVLPLAWLAVGPALAVSYTAGFTLMYLTYEVLHRRAHTHAPRGRYGLWLRRNHFAHHFVDPTRAHGVTTPVWDHVFGTTLDVQRVPVPRKLAMPWLNAAVDASGQLPSPLANHFELRGAG